ncbi:YqiA/YcfP family alpha/beta fold hydrolase [Thioalbus denitrificans]|uniref:Esterase n=1 Tax=Thioalbus denitrificans TaxID=547122 RepID=A0A369C0H0_9GAMM|nr:YqiA/YcfP family alpha/beta fold hydrolase [Thioalbus denitrificans]RCX26167.1 hypothetical protein DFQ59_11141 [Thioalbus denitrificans]
MSTPTPAILYIHGFNSSPESHKARILVARMEALGLGDRIRVPALSDRPERAALQLEAEVERLLPGGLALVGSSLGGYYATWLAERHGLRAVLVNPAVRPYELLADYLGPQQNLYTGERYELVAEHITALRALDVERVSHPGRFLLLLQSGDETLDFRQALRKYPDSPRILMAGGSHGFENFEAVAERVLRFCGVPPNGL